MTTPLPAYDDAHDRSAPIAAFSNSTEGFAWMERWCDTCALEDACPLIMLSMINRTPAEWAQKNPGGLSDRYDCSAYVVSDGQDHARG